MNQSDIHFHLLGRRLGFPFARTSLAIALSAALPANSQTPYPTRAAEMVLYQSAASKVLEKVRSEAPGVMVEISVKVGDPVRKGQILGHTELDATKLQLDLAQRAMESKANVEAAQGQAEAWTVTREETEDAVHRRKTEESRLSWAVAMEKMYRANYDSQLEVENVQLVQYEYWKQQYEKRFLKAPVDGIISEVLVDLGKGVNYATHVFTIRNENLYIIPIPVSAAVAEAASAEGTIPVRSSDGKSVSKAKVDSVSDDPRQVGGKVLKLMIEASDFPSALRAKLMGMKFDVLLPELAAKLE